MSEPLSLHYWVFEQPIQYVLICVLKFQAYEVEPQHTKGCMWPGRATGVMETSLARCQCRPMDPKIGLSSVPEDAGQQHHWGGCLILVELNDYAAYGVL